MKKNVIKKLSITLALIKLLNSGSVAFAINKTNNTYIFNDKNIETVQYGGNQKDFNNKFDILIQDPLIWAEVQKYFPITEFESEKDAMFFYKKYFYQIYFFGCGHVAVVNSIFDYFQGQEQEFERLFGFPMYIIKGDGTIDYNYELLILKFFNYIAFDSDVYNYSKSDIEKCFARDLYYEKLNSFIQSPDYIQRTPSDYHLYSQEEKLEFHEKVRISEEFFHELYQKWLNSTNEYHELGLPIGVHLGDIKGFLNKYGLDVDVSLYYDNNFKPGNIIVSDGFSLYKLDQNGKVINEFNNIKCHYVYVSEKGKNGMPIVSSFGNKYYFDNKNSNWTCRFKIIYKPLYNKKYQK